MQGENTTMEFMKQPYLQMPQATSIVVCWETDCPSSSEVQVWPAQCPFCGDVVYTGIGEPRVIQGESGNMHRVRVDTLNPYTDL